MSNSWKNVRGKRVQLQLIWNKTTNPSDCFLSCHDDVDGQIAPVTESVIHLLSVDLELYVLV